MTHRHIPFARARRALLGIAALLCFAGAIVLTPSDVRSQLNLRSHDQLAEPAPLLVQPLAALAPAGDAFAPRAIVEDEPRPPVPADPPLRLPRLAGNVLQMPRMAPHLAPLHVTAVATGSDPTAIVESGGVPRVVTIGDSLDGSTITAIDDDGIRLSGNRRLSLEAGAGKP